MEVHSPMAPNNLGSLIILGAAVRGTALVLEAYFRATAEGCAMTRAEVCIVGVTPHCFVELPSTLDPLEWKRTCNKLLQPNHPDVECAIVYMCPSTATKVIGFDTDRDERPCMFQVFFAGTSLYTSNTFSILAGRNLGYDCRYYHTDWPLATLLLCDLGISVGDCLPTHAFGSFSQISDSAPGLVCECSYATLKKALRVEETKGASQIKVDGPPDLLVAGCTLGPHYRIEVSIYRLFSDYPGTLLVFEGPTSLAAFARWVGEVALDILYHARKGNEHNGEQKYADETDLETIAQTKTKCIVTSMARLLSHPALQLRPPLESTELCSVLSHPSIWRLLAPLASDTVGTVTPDERSPWPGIEHSLGIIACLQESAHAMKLSLRSFLKSPTAKISTHFLQCTLYQQQRVFNVSWFRHNKVATKQEGLAESELPMPDGFHVTSTFSRGGYFLPPVQGETKGAVLRADFASYYPSIIQSFQIDFERVVPSHHVLALAPALRYRCIPIGLNVSLCLVESMDCGCGHSELRRPRAGFLSTTMRQLGIVRAGHRKTVLDAQARGDYLAEFVASTRETAIKLVMNSVYGLLGMSEKNMFAQSALAQAITFLGRFILQTTIARTLALGYIVRAAATDSMDVEFPYDHTLSATDNLANSEKQSHDLCAQINSAVPAPIKLVQARWLACATYSASKNTHYGLEFFGGLSAHALWGDGHQHRPIQLVLHTTGVPHTRRGVCVLARNTCQEVVSLLAHKKNWQCTLRVVGDFVQSLLCRGCTKPSDAAVSFEAKATSAYDPSAPLAQVLSAMVARSGRKIVVGTRYLYYRNRHGSTMPYLPGCTEQACPEFVVQQMLSCLLPLLSKTQVTDIVSMVSHARRRTLVAQSVGRPWSSYTCPSGAYMGSLEPSAEMPGSELPLRRKRTSAPQVWT